LGSDPELVLGSGNIAVDCENDWGTQSPAKQAIDQQTVQPLRVVAR
jgi:hypothetical protein